VNLLPALAATGIVGGTYLAVKGAKDRRRRRDFRDQDAFERVGDRRYGNWKNADPARLVEEARMQKRSGILDPLLYMPFSALASAITAPGDQRGKASAIGALLGAGMASMAQKEYSQRVARGEKVLPTDFNPMFKAVLTGLATGGGARVLRDVRSGEGVRPMSAILAGAPTGALLSGADPMFGAGIGSISGLVASKVTEPTQPVLRPTSNMTPVEFNRVRVEMAIQRSLNRIKELEQWLASTRRGSALAPSTS